MKKDFLQNFFTKSILSLCILFSFYFPVNAFPIFAQQAYSNPREATGRIVCANCHLATKKIEVESVSSVLPDSVFESVVKLPYNPANKQILANGQKGPVNFGAIMILPEGFKLAPKERLSDELKEKTKGVYIMPYSANKENILVVGPLSGDKNSTIVFPILSPNPEINKESHYVKYDIEVGGNRGRGQIYPTGEKSNNNAITSLFEGKILNIKTTENTYLLEILTPSEKIESQKISKAYNLIVKENQNIKKDENLTENPNVGGFGQADIEIVLQNPKRIYAYLAFCTIIILTQAIFVFKKKQYEKVQISEMDF